MLPKLKKRLEERKQKNKAIVESQYWKNHSLLRDCLLAMRGSCTVAPIDLHEALAAVVSIAMQEDTWTRTELVPADFLTETIFLLWDDARLPVFRAGRDLALQKLDDVTCVALETFLISETMDRVVHFGHGMIRLYSVSPEDGTQF